MTVQNAADPRQPTGWSDHERDRRLCLPVLRAGHRSRGVMMADLDTADDLDMLEWARAGERFDDFALDVLPQAQSQSVE